MEASAKDRVIWHGVVSCANKYCSSHASNLNYDDQLINLGFFFNFQNFRLLSIILGKKQRKAKGSLPGTKKKQKEGSSAPKISF